MRKDGQITGGAAGVLAIDDLAQLHALEHELPEGELLLLCCRARHIEVVA